jgi:hypothetical protein
VQVALWPPHRDDQVLYVRVPRHPDRNDVHRDCRVGRLVVACTVNQRVASDRPLSGGGTRRRTRSNGRCKGQGQIALKPGRLENLESTGGELVAWVTIKGQYRVLRRNLTSRGLGRRQARRFNSHLGCRNTTQIITQERVPALVKPHRAQSVE